MNQSEPFLIMTLASFGWNDRTRSTYKILLGKHLGKQVLKGTRDRMVILIGFYGSMFSDVKWIHVAQHYIRWLTVILVITESLGSFVGELL
jgi:hypothetical protein